MVDIEELNDTIEKLELRCDSMHACERLAWLYIVRDHMPEHALEGPRPMEGSEFLEAASTAEPAALLRVLDEHMEALKVVQPREYETVMARIRAIGKEGL